MTTNAWMYGVLSGVLFVPWTIWLKQSGVAPNLGATLFQLLSFVVIATVTATTQGTNAFRPVFDMTFRSWALIGSSALCGAMGIFFFNRGAATIPKESIPVMAIVMIVTQVVCQGAYSAIVNNGMSLQKVCALGLITAGVYLFSK